MRIQGKSDWYVRTSTNRRKRKKESIIVLTSVLNIRPEAKSYYDDEDAKQKVKNAR